MFYICILNLKMILKFKLEVLMAYNTRQRTLLQDFLHEKPHSHISMEEILAFAKEHKIGTATVYRYIDKLVKDGHLYKYNFPASKGGACFQWHAPDCNHYHFVCNDCGACFHVECPHLEEFNLHLSEAHGFRADLTRTVFRGQCAACAGKEVPI